MHALQRFVTATIPEASEYPWEYETKTNKNPKNQKEEIRIEPLGKSRSLLSSTSLQCILYFNSYFSVVWAITWMPICRWKYINFPSIFVYIDVTAFVIWCCCEAGRIVLGYYGNLQERVPHLASFLFVTIFPQFPIVLYMTAFAYPVTPFEQIGGSILVAFLIASLYFGYLALRVIIREQTARFLLDGLDSRDVDEDEHHALLTKEISDHAKELKQQGSASGGSVSFDPLPMLKEENKKSTALFQRTKEIEMTHAKNKFK